MMDTKNNEFPVKTDLGFLHISASILVVLMTGCSVAGVILGEGIYPGEIAVEFIANDALNLAVGVPLLLVCMILTLRKRLSGLLCYPGALLYVTYIYTAYLLGQPLGALFIPYLLLVSLSIYVNIGLIYRMDGEWIRLKLEGKVPVKTSGAILFSLATLFVIYQLYQIIAAQVDASEVSRIMIAQWIDDLVVAGPVALLAGYLMIRARGMGYALGMGMLLWLGILFIGLVPIIITKGVLSDIPVKILDLVIVVVSGLVSFIPFFLFARGIRKAV